MKGLSVYKVTFKKPSGWIVDVYILKDGTEVKVFNDARDLLHEIGITDEEFAQLLAVEKDVVKALCLYYQQRTGKHWTYSLEEIIRILKEKRVEVKRLELVDILQEVIDYADKQDV